MNNNQEAKTKDLPWIVHHAVVVISMIFAFFMLWLSFEYRSEFRIGAQIFTSVVLVFVVVLIVRQIARKK